MMVSSDNRPRGNGHTPLMILGVMAVLVPVFVLMTLDSVREQHDRIREELIGKGLFLIRAFEAGTRTGMITTRWGARRVQRLLSETAGQPEIDYMMITDDQGRILAHSREGLIGHVYEQMPDMIFPPGPAPLFHREVSQADGTKRFEVYKAFTPAHPRRRPRTRPRSGCAEDAEGNVRPCSPYDPTQGPPPGGERDWFRSHFDLSGHAAADRQHQVIFAGIDMTKADTLKAETLRHAVVMGVLFFLLGGAGIVCLLVIQGYRSARTSLMRVRAFSGEVVAHMPAGLVTLDRDLNVTSHNDAALEILGGVPENTAHGPETAGERIQIPTELSALAARLEQKGRRIAQEISCRRPDGQTLRLDVTASVIRTGEGNPGGYLFLFHDLTELRDLKQEVERSRRLAAVGKLAAGVAHEIRNPLSSLKGFALFFQERYSEDVETRQAGRIMVEAVERVNRSVTQLLDLARPMVVEKKEVNPARVVDHALHLMHRDFEASAVTVERRWVDPIPRLVTDPDRLNQILLNLFLNAVQAMEGGGRLVVSLSDGSRGDTLTLAVEDTGFGIEADDLDRIFDPYFTTRPQGTGLGLAMVHRTVEALGGDIRVESEPGRGTTFYIDLPKR